MIGAGRLAMPHQFWNASWFSVACAAALLVVTASAQVGAAQEPIENLVVHNAPKSLRPIKFENEAGETRSLTDFKGKVVVLNVWATWCVPCRREMPTLDRLRAALGGPDFEVVPISIDRGGIDAVRKFYADIAVHSLVMYVDRSGQILRDLSAVGLPTTLIINRDGQEVGRVIGPAEWDSAAIMQFLSSIVTQHDDRGSGRGGTGDAHIAETNQNAPGAMQHGLQWLKSLLGQ
jgi:thiol-disulfide isomerase/thioredoxin